jgi:hypothetical protein
MHDADQIERLRQAMMRWRELLEIMQARLTHSQAAYDALLATLPAERRAQLKEKEQLWEVAQHLLESGQTEPLQRAILKMQFANRDLERAFEEIYNHLVSSE